MTAATENRFPDRISFWLYALCITFLFFIFHGYQFNEGDQIEHLLPVYQKLNPGLYTTDFFMVSYHQTFTVRYFYVLVISALSHLFPVSTVCFSLNFLCIFFASAGYMKICGQIGGNRAAQLLTPILVLVIFYYFTVGGNQVEYSILTCSTMAKAFIPWAIFYFLRRNFLISGILLGAATLFQVLAGFQVFLILSVVLFLEYRFSGKKSFLFPIGYLPIGLMVLVPLISRQFGGQVVYDHALYAEIMNRFRNPLHFDPSLFPVIDWLMFLFMIAASLLCLLKLPIRHKGTLLIFLGTVVTGILFYLLLYNGLRIYDVSKTQWFKSTIWVEMFGSTLIAIVISRWKITEKLTELFLKWLKPVSLIFLAGAIFIVFFGAYNPIQKMQSRYRVGFYKLTAADSLYDWIQENTPENALFLTSPGNDRFQCEARRGMAVSYKAIIHEPFYLFPWYQRVKDIYGVSIEKMNKDSTVLNQAEARYKTRYFSNPAKYGIKFRIDNSKECEYRDSLGPVIKQYGDWILTACK